MGRHPPEWLPGQNLYAARHPLLRMNPEELNDHVETHGIGAELRRAVACPCRRPDTNTPRVACQSCAGLGYAYPAELRCPIVVLLHSRQASERKEPLGHRASGTAKCTFPTGIEVTMGDLVLPDAETHAVQQVLVRQRGDEVDRAALRAALLARGATADQRAVAVVAPGERLLYPSVDDTAVRQVYWFDEVAQEARRARIGTDVEVTSGRVIWRDGRGPARGGSYTVQYRAPAAYIVSMDASPVHRSDDDRLYPIHATLQRLDRWHAAPRDLRGGA